MTVVDDDEQRIKSPSVGRSSAIYNGKSSIEYIRSSTPRDRRIHDSDWEA